MSQPSISKTELYINSQPTGEVVVVQGEAIDLSPLYEFAGLMNEVTRIQVEMGKSISARVEAEERLRRQLTELLNQLSAAWRGIENYRALMQRMEARELNLYNSMVDHGRRLRGLVQVNMDLLGEFTQEVNRLPREADPRRGERLQDAQMIEKMGESVTRFNRLIRARLGRRIDLPTRVSTKLRDAAVHKLATEESRLARLADSQSLK